MDYKKIIKSRDLRIKLLRLFDWIPDKSMIKFQYKMKTGRKLNLKNPQRFTEKLQWYKLYYKNPIMKQCVDKYDVRDYIKSKGLGCILNDVYGIFDKIEDINFDVLPNKFVIKDTLGGGGNSVIIVDDKSKADFTEIKITMSKWLSTSIKRKSSGREWPYEGNKHRIIIEKYIESDIKDGGLVDYKLFCFNGLVDYLYIINGRCVGKHAKLGIYDKDFNKLNVYRNDEFVQEEIFKMPKNYSQMVEYAKIISQEFPHARVDFYNVRGKIIFGEITFFDGSGYMKYNPDSFDYELGKNFDLVKY